MACQWEALGITWVRNSMAGEDCYLHPLRQFASVGTYFVLKQRLPWNDEGYVPPVLWEQHAGCEPEELAW